MTFRLFIGTLKMNRFFSHSKKANENRIASRLDQNERNAICKWNILSLLACSLK